VVVVGKHYEDALGGEECGFAVGELFGCAGEGECEFADSVDLGFSGYGHDGFSMVDRLPLFQIGLDLILSWWANKNREKRGVACLHEVLALSG